MLFLPVLLFSLNACQSAKFEVSPLEVISDKPVTGDIVTITAEINNTGLVDGVYKALLYVDGSAFETKNINIAANASAKISFNYLVSSPGEHTFQLGDVTTKIIALASALFVVTDIKASPVEVLPEENITVKADIQNTGDIEGGFDASLVINGSVENKKNITLAGGASQSVTFNFTRGKPGEYVVNIGSMKTTVKVIKPAEVEIDSLQISPDLVPAGDDIAAEVVLRNYGEASGNYLLSITANDEVVGTKEIELKGGEQKQITIFFNLSDPGNYEIKAGDHVKQIRVIDPTRPATGTYIAGQAASNHNGYLKVDNGCDLDSLVVLTSRSKSKIPVVVVFVRAGDSCTIYPGRGDDLGYFYVYFASGTNWDNYAKEFTTDKSFKKFEDVFNFSTYNYTVTLYPVVGGTGSTERLSEDDFPLIK